MGEPRPPAVEKFLPPPGAPHRAVGPGVPANAPAVLGTGLAISLSVRGDAHGPDADRCGAQVRRTREDRFPPHLRPRQEPAGVGAWPPAGGNLPGPGPRRIRSPLRSPRTGQERLMPYSPVSEILDDLRAGKMVILQDDPRRWNEGDLVVAAELVTPETVHFFLREARGKMCLAMPEDRADDLHLPVQVTRNTSFHHTAFAVTFDAKEGAGTGESARDRATSIRRAADPSCGPSDRVRPGHIDPLRARAGGVLVRT